jgi:hypothetical protein
MSSLAKLFKDYDRMLERLDAEKVTSKRIYRSKRSRQRCGAFARSTGKPCRMKALANGRCRLHGGLSTGPKTAEGKAKALANLKQFQ